MCCGRRAEEEEGKPCCHTSSPPYTPPPLSLTPLPPHSSGCVDGGLIAAKDCCHGIQGNLPLSHEHHCVGTVLSSVCAPHHTAGQVHTAARGLWRAWPYREVPLEGKVGVVHRTPTHTSMTRDNLFPLPSPPLPSPPLPPPLPSVCSRPCPFVYCYDKISGIDLAVDARNYGNIARFIRRACSANCEVSVTAVLLPW